MHAAVEKLDFGSMSRGTPVQTQFDGFDPTSGAAMVTELKYPSIGKTPSGCPKIHVEMLPGDLMRLIAYDPRALATPPKGKGARDPQNISPDIISLHRRIQRSIDQAKVNEMVRYLFDAVSNGRFADWSEIDAVTCSRPDTGRYQTEFVVVMPNAADYFITDGQHRYCAILDFARMYPHLAGLFTQALAVSVLPHDRLAEWAGQSFHDKNYLRSPVKATKALAVDSRDAHNRLAKELRQHPLIQQGGGVNEVKDSLAASAKEFATHAMLFKFVRGFCEGRRGLDKAPISDPILTDESYDELANRIEGYLGILSEVLPNWTVVPGREDYLFRASAAFQGLGVLGHVLYAKVVDQKQRNAMIAAIGEKQLDWRRTNLAWQGVIGSVREDGVVSPTSQRQAIDGTIKFLRDKSGLTAYLNE